MLSYNTIFYCFNISYCLWLIYCDINAVSKYKYIICVNCLEYIQIHYEKLETLNEQFLNLYIQIVKLKILSRNLFHSHLYNINNYRLNKQWFNRYNVMIVYMYERVHNNTFRLILLDVYINNLTMYIIKITWSVIFGYIWLKTLWYFICQYSLRYNIHLKAKNRNKTSK